MSTENLDQLFAPRCLAVMADFCSGSDKEQLLFNNLSQLSGHHLYFVGAPCLPPGIEGTVVDRLEQIQEPIDILLFARPPSAIRNIFHSKNIDAVANLVLLGFDEDISPTLQQEMLAESRRRQIRILGGNSIGILIPGRQLNASYHPTMPHQGKIALISQSGALITSILDIAREQNIGFSHVVSIGSLLDIDFGDLIDYLGDNEQVTAIALYMENIKNVKKFLSACRSVSRIKPIIALKSGRHPRIQALIRQRLTGGQQLGDTRVYESAFRRAGIIAVESINELLTAGTTLSTRNIPHGDRYAIITNSDALGMFSIDQLLLRKMPPVAIDGDFLEQLKKILPGQQAGLNLINVGPTADNRRFLDTASLALESGRLDALIILMVINGFIKPQKIVAELEKRHARFPARIFYAWLGGSTFHRHKARDFMRDDIPVFSSLEETLKAYYYSERYRYKLTKLMAIPPLFDDAAPVHKGRARQLVAPFLKTKPSPLPETVARDLLGIYGIHGTTVSTAAEDPVGLTLNSSWDPEFGPFIALGLGGSCARFNPDIAIMLPPLNPLLARRMIDKSPAGPILKTYPLEKLIELLLRFSTLLCDFAELRQAGIELQCDRQGNLRLTRAALEVATSSIEPPRHLVIMPYPSQYQFHETLANGTRVLIRPIKPEDEEKHFAFFHSLSRQTNYYRFFSYRKKLTHEQITRFTQIDYDREMAIIALVEENGKEKTIGVNRLVYYPRDDRYEFALVVTDDWQDKGVGKVLMEKLISIARDRGIKTIYGNILAENNRMIQFCRRFGFKEYQSEGEVVLVKLEL